MKREIYELRTRFFQSPLILHVRQGNSYAQLFQKNQIGNADKEKQTSRKKIERVQNEQCIITRYEKLLSEDMKDLKIRKEMEKQEQVQASP